MSTIFCSSNENRLRHFAGRRHLDLLLLDTNMGRAHHANQIALEKLNDEQQINLEKEYIELISALGDRDNNRSLSWWANPLSEKNEHLSETFDHIYHYCRLIGYLTKNPESRSFCLLSDKAIYRQLKEFSLSKPYLKVYSLDQPAAAKLAQLLGGFKYFFSVFTFLVKTLVKKILVFVKIGSHGNQLKDTEHIARTWINENILDKSEDNYTDDYFGSLIKFLTKRKKKFILVAGIIGDYSKILSALRQFKQMPIVPEEYFLKFRHLFSLVRHLKFRRQQLGEVYISGVNIRVLLENELNAGYKTTSYLANILRYYVAENIGRQIKAKTFLYPFENYAWEKTTILGLRNTNPELVIKGFQHAFISRNSFKYFIGSTGKNTSPLPNQIITMGKITKQIMAKYGGYAPDIFIVGCALRQEYLSKISPLPRNRRKRLLVPLTMATNESVSIFNFLYQSKLAQSGYEVVIRTHPNSPFESFKSRINFTLPDNFRFSVSKDLLDELTASSLVLYTWTTVAIEALKLGIPVIYLDILRPKYVDPLFDCPSLKRTAAIPAELIKSMQSLASLSDADYLQEQSQAQAYLKDYFYPVTDETMSVFL